MLLAPELAPGRVELGGAPGESTAGTVGGMVVLAEGGLVPGTPPAPAPGVVVLRVVPGVAVLGVAVLGGVVLGAVPGATVPPANPSDPSVGPSTLPGASSGASNSR